MRISNVEAKRLVINRGKRVQIIVNGQPVVAYEGELVSTALHAEGIRIFNLKHQTGKPAGIYCGMGVCYECLVTVNGVPNTRACQTTIENGMTILTATEEQS